MEETTKAKDKSDELECSVEYLKMVYDYACRDLEHGRDVKEAYKDANWAANELMKRGITPT